MQDSVHSSDSSIRLQSQWLGNSPLMDASYEAADGDLSISELSLNELPASGPSRPPRPKFSLLAPRDPSILDSPEEDSDVPRNEVEDAEGVPVDNSEDKRAEVLEEMEKRKRMAAKTREERLQHDLFILKKLNSAFSVYNDALRDTRSSTERVAEQLEQTNALLDKYVTILAKSETVTRVIFDERWRGADHDEEILERERAEAELKAQREKEEQILAAKREQERLEREEKERRIREEKERIEAEKREKLAVRAGYGGIRGVRGTRASMRARGASRIAPPPASVRGRPPATVSSTTSATGGRVPRPTSSASIRSTTSTTSSRIG